MSYSRWSNGNWYVFWCYTDTEEMEQEMLALWHVSGPMPHMSYERLKNMTLEEFKDIFPEDAEEGWGYVQEWLKDVEDEYKDSDIRHGNDNT